jgi:uncharacterized phage protein (TIGR01671 family)
MRDIKFRGKRLDNGEWVYGDLVQIEGSYIYDYDIGDNGVEQKPILSQIKWNVNPKTVGQSTGLKDKNGVEVYEGDIAKVLVWLHGINTKIIGAVVYRHYGFRVEKTGLWAINLDHNTEVIGNIYENLELLEGER